MKSGGGAGRQAFDPPEADRIRRILSAFVEAAFTAEILAAGSPTGFLSILREGSSGASMQIDRAVAEARPLLSKAETEAFLRGKEGLEPTATLSALYAAVDDMCGRAFTGDERDAVLSAAQLSGALERPREAVEVGRLLPKGCSLLQEEPVSAFRRLFEAAHPGCSAHEILEALSPGWPEDSELFQPTD